MSASKKAATARTTTAASKLRDLPLGQALPAAITRLQEIAALAGDALLTEGPVHPDHELLGLCAEALHIRRRSVDLEQQYHAFPAPYGRPPATTEQNRQRDEIYAELVAADALAVRLTRRAAKFRATTAAGIYAKALVVRSARSVAAMLAMSLAEDLIACDELRRSLWPAEIAGRVEA
jgi:hypothetical protein